MGRLMKKKKKKTKGTKPRLKIDQTDESIIISTPASKTEVFQNLYMGDMDFGKVEERVVNSGLNMTVRSEEPDRIEISEFGSDKIAYMDIEDGQIHLTAGEPADPTMRWTDEPTSPITNACSEVVMDTRYGKVDPDEVADRIRQLHKEKPYKDTAKKFEELGEVLENALERIKVDEAEQPKTSGDRFGHTYGEFKGYGYSEYAEREETEPAIDPAYDDEEYIDESYLLNHEFAENENRDGEATEESTHFLGELGGYLGYGDLTEMVSEATAIPMDKLYNKLFIQAYISHTIRWARDKIRGPRNDMGRCESIW